MGQERERERRGLTTIGRLRSQVKRGVFFFGGACLDPLATYPLVRRETVFVKIRLDPHPSHDVTTICGRQQPTIYCECFYNLVKPHPSRVLLQ